MPLLKKDPKEGWILVGREGAKHRGQTLVKVAEIDPSYLTFLWSNSLKYLNKEATDALDDIMEKNNIEREFKRKKKRNDD